MRTTGARSGRWAITVAAVGALAMTGCGDEASDDGGEDAAEAAEAAAPADAAEGDEADAADDGAVEEAAVDAADEPAEGEESAGEAPANGVLTVDGEELALETAYRCPPSERVGGDGELVFHTITVGPDVQHGLVAWEEVEDGVSTHRVGAHAPGLYTQAEHRAEEGSPDYPLFELDGDRISVRAILPGEGAVEVEIEAEWDVPAEEWQSTLGPC